MTSPYENDILSKWIIPRREVAMAAALRRMMQQRDAEIGRMLGIYAAGVYQAGWPLPTLYFTAHGDMAGLGAPVRLGGMADLRVPSLDYTLTIRRNHLWS